MQMCEFAYISFIAPVFIVNVRLLFVGISLSGMVTHRYSHIHVYSWWALTFPPVKINRPRFADLHNIFPMIPVRRSFKILQLHQLFCYERSHSFLSSFQIKEIFIVHIIHPIYRCGLLSFCVSQRFLSCCDFH